MKPVTCSGQAILADDEMERCRRIADVLAHDMAQRRDLTIAQREDVLDTIARYRLRADLIEATLKPYRGF